MALASPLSYSTPFCGPFNQLCESLGRPATNIKFFFSFARAPNFRLFSIFTSHIPSTATFLQDVHSIPSGRTRSLFIHRQAGFLDLRTTSSSTTQIKMFSHTSIFFAIVGGFLASFANAHMIMAQPVPFGVKTLNNSPLGNDYPCKQRAGVYDVSSMNNMEVGKPQALSFSGTAIHGGGSCQISVSLDKNPTPSSTFKVIHTIEGDCPGANAPESFQFKIPDGFPNGEFALAWTWFNEVSIPLLHSHVCNRLTKMLTDR